MISDFNYKLRIYNILISMFLLITLQIDYFVTKELWMESSFVVGISLLILVNIGRQISSKVNSISFLTYAVNGLIIITGLYSISILLLIFWGYGFTGKETPLIWISAFVLSLLLEIVIFVELWYCRKS